jgi:hypothetical protein
LIWGYREFLFFDSGILVILEIGERLLIWWISFEKYIPIIHCFIDFECKNELIESLANL